MSLYFRKSFPPSLLYFMSHDQGGMLLRYPYLIMILKLAFTRGTQFSLATALAALRQLRSQMFFLNIVLVSLAEGLKKHTQSGSSVTSSREVRRQMTPDEETAANLGSWLRNTWRICREETITRSWPSSDHPRWHRVEAWPPLLPEGSLHCIEELALSSSTSIIAINSWRLLRSWTFTLKHIYWMDSTENVYFEKYKTGFHSSVLFYVFLVINLPFITGGSEALNALACR